MCVCVCIYIYIYIYIYVYGIHDVKMFKTMISYHMVIMLI